MSNNFVKVQQIKYGSESKEFYTSPAYINLAQIYAIETIAHVTYGVCLKIRFNQYCDIPYDMYICVQDETLNFPECIMLEKEGAF